MRQLEHSIITYTGQRVWPLEPLASDLNIVDIAHALSNQCRFSGHTKKFYSVAQHSVLVSRITSPENRLWSLLHDASEAYLVDMATPVKRQMPEYRAVEERLMKVVAEAFNLPWPLPAEVHSADHILLLTEFRDVTTRGRPTNESATEPEQRPLDYQIIPWSPEVAERRFLSEYRELTGNIPAQFTSGGEACATGQCGMIDYDLETKAMIQIADHMANTPTI